MAFQVLLAGQDITMHVDQMSIQIDDTLGQGPGAGATHGTSARATTCKFNTDLGPMNTAIGAGQQISGGPKLVRNGELIINDATGVTIFGGYASKFSDITTSSGLGISTHPHTEVNAVDYTSALGRTLVNVTYSSQTDVQIISQVLTQYVPWVDQSLLPATGLFLLPAKVFRNISVLQVLQKVAGITGWIVWVDFHKKIHYTSPANTQSAPFYVSDQPDFITSFPHAVTQFEIDDTSAINRVYFYGGKKTSNDFTQDVSPQANGSNKVFTLAYYPRVASDGKFHVTKVTNFSDNLVVGIANGTTPPNILKSQGGLADVLINPDAHNVTFDVAPAACTGCVLVKYRYNFPLSIVVSDSNSVAFFGAYLDGYVSDDTVFDQIEGIQRAKVVLTQQSFGLVTLKLDTWHAGLQAGQTIQVINAVRGINLAYLIQEVVTEPLGAGNFVWHVTLGAWNWNLIDVIVKLASIAPVDDTSDTETTSILQIYQIAGNVVLHDAWTHSDTMHRGPYYARASALGDGHDAFPGFSTVST